jgi:Tol biopolymer transport system component
MSEYRPILEQARERFAPPDMPLEGILRRRDRKRRNQRVTAGVVGLAIGLVAIVIGGSILRSSPKVPANPNPTPVMSNGPITVFGFTGGLRSLSLDGRHERSLVRCQGSCTLVSSAAWSPDGTHVAFSVSCGGGCGSGGDPYHGIRVVDLATGDDHLLVKGDLFRPSLDWSPDGSRISYVEDGRIHIMDADGSNRTVVPGTSDPVVTASWSPDGARFAYRSSGALSLISVDGSDPTVIVPPTYPTLFAPTWSPDGQKIAYRTACDVWVTTPGGEDQTRIADLRSIVSAPRCEPDLGSSEELAWSPDGQQIAVFVEDGRFRRVVLMQADGSNVRVLSQVDEKFPPFGLAWQPIPPTSSPDEATSGLAPVLQNGEALVRATSDLVGGSVNDRLDALDPTTGDRRTLAECIDPCVFFHSHALSADGRWLAYEEWTCLGALPCESEAGIWVTNALGDHRQLTHECDQPDSCHDDTWAWSPDGATLATYEGGAESQLFTIDPSTGDRTTLAIPDGDVTALAWSPDGSGLAYAAGGPTPGVYFVHVEGGDSIVLTNDVGEVQNIAWSPDGTRLVLDDFRNDRNRIIVMNADGSDLRILVDQGAPQGPGAPAWSPDGTQIAYVTTPGYARPHEGHFSFEVWVIGADGSNPIRLHQSACCIGDWDGPVWSPDGTRVAFFDDIDLDYGHWLAVNADGTGSPDQIDDIEAESWRS